MRHCVPTSIGQCHPPALAGHCGEKAEHLCVTGRPMTPPVAVALDQLRAMLRIRVPHEKTILDFLVSTHDVRRAGEGECDEVRSAELGAHRGERLDDAERAVGNVVKACGDSRTVLPVNAGVRGFGAPGPG